MLIRRAIESDFEAIWDIFKAVIEPGDTYVFAPNTSSEDAFSYWFGTDVTTGSASNKRGIGRVEGISHLQLVHAMPFV